MNIKTWATGLIIFFGCSIAAAAQVSKTDKGLRISSPDKKVVTDIQVESGKVTYSLSFNGKQLMSKSSLGVSIWGNKPSFTLDGMEAKFEVSTWKPVFGKREKIQNQYNVVNMKLDDSASGNKINLEFRVYNDGIAFRYTADKEGLKIAGEDTTFSFAGDYTLWAYNGEKPNIGPIKISAAKKLRYPVTFKASDDCYMAFMEGGANTIYYSSIEKAESGFKITPPKGARACGKLLTPWRVLMIGDSPGALIDSNILENVNTPGDREKFAWVKPGVCFWDWRAWGHKAEDFNWELGLKSWKRFVDFASETGVPYLLLDANWYGEEFNPKSDPLKGGKVLDVHTLIAYAKKKNVNIVVYLNDAITKNFDVEEVISAYARWGIKGIKYGFMRGDKLKKTQRVIELCAKYKLLCNFHDGPLPPSGDYITWPSCITKEFCHAQSDAKKAFVPKTFVTSVYVNNLCGPIDMNNGMFDLNNSKKQRPKVFAEIPSTIVAEAARTLIVFSGLVVVTDSADSYRKHLELFKFVAAQKMPWKQSKTIAGKIGEFIVTARQAADDIWLLAAATNEEARELKIPLDFLGEGKYSATIFEDAPDAHYKTNREAYKSRKKDVTSADSITAKLAPGGGFCVILKK